MALKNTNFKLLYRGQWLLDSRTPSSISLSRDFQIGPQKCFNFFNYSQNQMEQRFPFESIQIYSTDIPLLPF
jgi:hypothetical protein